MDSTAQVLIVLLSITLIAFLVLAIILFIYLIKLTRDIRSITRVAERAASNIESTVDNITRAVTPMFAAEMISKVISAIRNRKKKGDK